MAADARDGSSKSSWLAQWIKDHAGSMMERLRIRAKRKADAEDAFQQTILSILELEDHRLAKVKNPQAYIYAAAVRKLAAMQAANARSHSTTQLVPEPPPELSRDDLLERLHCQRILTEDLNRLPDLHRRVLVLRGLGLNRNEIAEECSVKPYKVDRILFEARTAMQPTYKGSD